MAVSKLDDDIKWRPRNKWVCHNMVALHMRRFCCLAILILNFTHYNCGSLHTTRYTNTHYNQALHMQQQRQFCCLAPLMVRGAESDWRADQTPVCRPTITKTEANHENKQFLFLNFPELSQKIQTIPSFKRTQVSALTFALDSSAVAATVLSIFVVTGWLLFQIGTMTGRSDKLEQWGSNSDLVENFYIEMEHFHPFWIQAETKFHLFWILYQSYWWWSKICQAFLIFFLFSGLALKPGLKY